MEQNNGVKRRRVALVLAGGGARGVAHIGAIEELERRGYEIGAVAGTSMGALVGGMYASGHLEEFKEWMCALDRYRVFSLVDFTFSTEGLVKGSRVIEAMKELIPDMRIEQMRIPFTAVSADLLSGSEVVIERGGLYDAIRASIAIPSVFRPVHRDGMVLTDGGIVNPLPLNRVRRWATCWWGSTSAPPLRVRGVPPRMRRRRRRLWATPARGCGTGPDAGPAASVRP